jgi:hypothetical protein
MGAISFQLPGDAASQTGSDRDGGARENGDHGQGEGREIARLRLGQSKGRAKPRRVKDKLAGVPQCVVLAHPGTISGVPPCSMWHWGWPDLASLRGEVTPSSL